jgi:Lon protease-like protein
MNDLTGRFQLPLFPLNTVLFPGGRLPLKIFEQRYVEMTKRCVRDATPFGICMILEGKEVGAPALPVDIGCTAIIEQWDVPHPNLFELVALGERRFKIHRTEVAALGLLVCEAEYLPATDSSEAPDALCRRVMAQVVERAGAAHFAGPIQLDDAVWVSWRLSEILPLSNEVRQQLLETDTAAARLAQLREVLTAAGIT